MDRRNDEPAPVARPSAAPSPETQKPEKERVFLGTGLFWSLILGLLLGAALVIFVFQNTQSVDVQWLGFDFTAPLIGLLLATALIAVIIDQTAGVLYRRRRRRIRTEREELERLRGRQASANS